ncbi:MAG: tRNA (adenosine(37)-N6)-threonylcarbamoyltransferase complex transferase subunit TsaD, partial [Eubacteriales bacterium]
QQYGGVVPELASRNHIPKLPEVVDEALLGGFGEIDVIATTAGPGLLGSLLTGVSYAKALAFALKKPLVAVNHIEGHISAGYISYLNLEPPFICLVVSGGHTMVVLVREYCNYELFGQTRDDAAGEAIDKVARVLGLSYPGGPNLERLALEGDNKAYKMPRCFKGENHLDFSFSGPKTAVINLLHGMEQRQEEFNPADVAASFQFSVVQMLANNTFEAARRAGISRVALAGGVSANSALREEFLRRGKKENIEIFLPNLKYCTDNAAMIASAAYYRYIRGERAGWDLNAAAVLPLEKTFNKMI